MTVRLATRGSALARAQAELARTALSGADTELVIVSSPGDRNPDAAIAELSGQGWFTSEVEATILDGRADAGVHSAKDLPLSCAAGLGVAAFLPRADVRDAVVTRDGGPLDDLPRGARVGTSSARRAAWLTAMRSDLVAVAIRGNVDTRLAKLERGDVDALLLAAAGLDRLGLGDRATERLDPAVFVPAPAQGAVALEAPLTGETHDLIAAADDADTRAAVEAERAVLEGLGGGCLLPLGAWAEVTAGRLLLRAAFEKDGRVGRTELEGPVDDARDLGLEAAGRLR